MNLIIPQYVRVLANRFKDLCKDNVPGSYFTGLQMLFILFCDDFDSVCNLLRQNTWTLSESQFLAMVDSFPTNRFMRRLRWSVLSRFKDQFDPRNFRFVVDDTDNPKYAKIATASKFRSSKGLYKGQKVLVIALIHEKENFAIPLTFRFCLPKKHPDHKKGPELVIELLKELLNFGFPPLGMVADSWFDSKDLAADLEETGVPYYWELKSNRKARHNPGQYVKKIKIGILFQKLKKIHVSKRQGGEKDRWIAESRIQINGRKSMLKAIAVYNKKSDKDAFALYGSTDLSITGERLWQISRSRWAIECLFRDLKQNLGFGRFKSRKKNAVDLAVVIPFIIYTFIRLEPGILGLDQDLTVGESLKILRRDARQRSLKSLKSARGRQKMANLIIRQSNQVSKPCVTACGRVKSQLNAG